MKKYFFCLLIVLLAVPASAIDIKDVELGGQIRFRGYDIQNVWDFDDDTDTDNISTFRHKTSLFLNVKADENITGYIKLSNQNYGESGASAKDFYEDNRSNKIFVDNAYIDIHNLFHSNLDLKLGRQNLFYGSGFVIADGQSQMASTSVYFDGARLRWNISDAVTLDALYFKDQENTTNEAAEDDVTLTGVYFTSGKTPVIGGKQELYILNRNDENLKKDIFLYGARLSDKFKSGLDYSAEIGIQTGDFNATTDQDALGYKLDLGYTFNNVSIKPRFFIGYASLSGNDPNTADNESWDVFYGGWPQFGDLLAWKFVNIGGGNNISSYDPSYNSGSSYFGEAVFSNLHIATAGIGTKLFEKISVKASYSMLTIDETAADDDFGDYYQVSVKYPYSKSLSFAAYAAMIDPGDAFGTDTDKATEFFWEASFNF